MLEEDGDKQMLAVKGIYKNGKVSLLEKVETNRKE